MFNKKENIEDDFMGYSSNSSSGNDTQIKKSSGGLGSTIQLLVIFILLAIIAVGGMFGYKYLQNDKSTQNVNIADKSAEAINTPKVEAITKKTTEVKPKTSEQKMYTQEQMQEIVKMMMANIQSNSTTNQVETDDKNEEDNSDLMNSLSNIDVDQIDSISTEDTDTDTTQKVTASSSDKIDRYNKVVVDNVESDLDDLASQLNNTIEALDQGDSTKSTYTKSITQEVSTRKNEMRVIIVKNGDSLSKIAARAYGSASAYITIMEANPDLIKNPNRIYVGQRLRVPLKIN